MMRQNAKTVEGVSNHVPALQRGLALLEVLATRPRGATQAELASELGLPQTAVHRIALALEELGYVQRVPGTRTLRVTQKLLLLGQPYSGSRSLIEACLPAMREILSLTNETTQLCVLAGSKCVIIEQLASRHPFKYVVDLGSQAPVQCCAPGKAILAHLEPQALEPVLEEIDFQRHTPHSLMSLRALRRELLLTRERGYAIDRAEHFEGIHCLAAPLRDVHGHAFAAITIAGPSTRIPESRFHAWGEAIAAMAADAALAFLL
jgi:DNA-binding IclR family transcriptional regulator